jgi:D-glycero-D-manno-heptose 1,7-bisphosphate phosphatase
MDRQGKKAVFLDRDGVLNREIGRYLQSVDEFEVLPHVAEVLAELKERGYLLIIISNQGGIAKGEVSRETVDAIFTKLFTELMAAGVVLDAWYYCPHHPDVSPCRCRKPDSLLFEQAIEWYDIDPAASYMIGDRERDIEAAAKVGVSGILIESNQDLRTVAHLIR